MRRIRLSTLALAAGACIALAAAIACELEHRGYPKRLAGLTPLRVSIAEAENVRSSFTAVWSERHYVALVFPGNVDIEMATALDQAISAVGRANQGATRFDFDWRVLEGAVEVGRGSGQTNPTSSFGSRERGLGFGEFPALAGHTYELEVRRGPGFEQFLRATPVVEIGVNSPGPSLGLPLIQEFARPLAGIFAVVGLGLLTGAVLTARERAG